VRESNLKAYLKYYDTDEVLPKASLSLLWDQDIPVDWILAQKAKFKRLRINTVKFFMDGVIESKTAFLHSPYCHSDTRGMQYYKKEQLYKLMETFDKEGFQVPVVPFKAKLY
jgi:predicted amidohydrolase YtcJ